MFISLDLAVPLRRIYHRSYSKIYVKECRVIVYNGKNFKRADKCRYFIKVKHFKVMKVYICIVNV